MEYRIELGIDVKAKEYKSKISLRQSSQKDDIKEFLIHRDTHINEIMVNGNLVEWVMEDVELSFIPEAKKLILKLEPEVWAMGSTTIEFDIKGYIDIIKYDINQISDNFIELNIYSPWYPVAPDLREAEARIAISGLDDFYVLKASKNDGKWNLNLEGMDNYIIAFHKPQISGMLVEAGLIRVISNNNSEVTGRIQSGIKEILDFYNNIFYNNSAVERQLDIVIAPRINGGGYCRENLIVMTEAKLTKVEYERFLAHELSHLWFVGAKVLSWEDWLNESFAEYCSLLYIEEKYGREPYETAINKYKEYTKNCPPVKGSDRNSEEGSKIRYKGTVVLHEMRELFGLRRVQEVFNILYQLEVKTTNNLIDKLKTTNDELACFLEEKIG